jgi:hypothetical protein
MTTWQSDSAAAAAYDEIVRELYSAGLALYGVAARLGPGPTADRLLEGSAHLDAAIKRVGVLALALHDGPVTRPGRFAARLLDALSTATPAVTGVPTTRLAGPVGDLPEDLVDDLLTVAHRALTHLAADGDGTSLEVDITVADGGLCLQVSAHGAGPAARYRGDGAERPTVRGAPLVAQPRPRGGTRLTWTVPVHQAPADPGAGSPASGARRPPGWRGGPGRW